MGNQRKEQIQQGNAFQDAVERTHDLNGGYCPGLQALKKVDAARISIDDGSKADGSVDIDNCTKEKYPNATRWDYGVGYGGETLFIEVHPASTSEVTKMKEKLSWLKSWLKSQAPELDALPKHNPAFCWIASGKVAILKGSREHLSLSKLGLLPSKHLTIK